MKTNSGTGTFSDESYPPPLGNVLLLSCMDLRLLDNTGAFMNHDNLTNRYDHVIFAGASLGALGGCHNEYTHWRRTFFDHLAAACELHGIEDVYILEHRHCGAYHKVFKVAPEFGDTPSEQQKEADCHHKYAKLLTQEIGRWGEGKGLKLRVRSFIMDVRGHVSLLTDRRRVPRKKSS